MFQIWSNIISGSAPAEVEKYPEEFPTLETALDTQGVLNLWYSGTDLMQFFGVACPAERNYF